MESQVLQTRGLVSWASLKPLCGGHSRLPSARPSPAALQRLQSSRCSSLVSPRITRLALPCRGWCRHIHALELPDNTAAGLQLPHDLLFMTVASVMQNDLKHGVPQQLQQSLPQRFHTQKRCLHRVQAETEASVLLPEVLPTDNIADLEKILAEKGECGVRSCALASGCCAASVFRILSMHCQAAMCQCSHNCGYAGRFYHKLEEGQKP